MNSVLVAVWAAVVTIFAWLRSLLPAHIYSTAIIAIVMVTPFLVAAISAKELVFLHVGFTSVWAGAMITAGLICAQRRDHGKGIIRPINIQLLVVLGSLLAVLGAFLGSVLALGVKPYLDASTITGMILGALTGIGALIVALLKKDDAEGV